MQTRKRWTDEQRKVLKDILDLYEGSPIQEHASFEDFWTLVAGRYNNQYPEETRTWRACHEEWRRLTGKRKRAAQKDEPEDEATTNFQFESISDALVHLQKDLDAALKANRDMEATVVQMDKKVRAAMGKQTEILNLILEHLTAGTSNVQTLKPKDKAS